MNKEWTQEERIRASRQIYARRFGSDDASYANHEHWAVDRGDIGAAIDIQCELNDAAEMIEQYRDLLSLAVGDRITQLERKSRAWLKRNAPVTEEK